MRKARPLEEIATVAVEPNRQSLLITVRSILGVETILVQLLA